METGAPPPTPESREARTWTLPDILRAVGLSFDRDKLLTGALGLFLAFFVFGATRWMGLLTGEEAAVRVFSLFGLLLASCVWVVFSGVIARMSLSQLLDGRKATIEELRRFLLERWTTLVGTPVAFGGLSVLLLAAMALMMVAGKLPGLGPIFFSGSFLLAFGLAFSAALVALVHAIGAFLYPSIVALRECGAVAVVSEMLDLVRRRGIHVLLYQGVVAAVGLLMTGIVGFAAWAGLYIVNWSALAIMGESFSLSLMGIPRFFRIFLRPFEPWLPLIPDRAAVAWHYDISGFFLGFSLLWILVATAVYPFVFFNTAGSIAYLILREDGQESPPAP